MRAYNDSFSKKILVLIPLLFLSPVLCPCQAGNFEDPDNSALSGSSSLFHSLAKPVVRL